MSAPLERTDISVRGGMDRLDLALLDELRADGRASNRSLATALGVNEVTVATRLRRLDEDKLLRVVAVTDFEALGHEFLAFGKVRVTGRPVLEVGAELADIPENIAVVATLGRHDLVLSTLARDRQHLGELVGGRIPSVAGIDVVRWELTLEVLVFRSETAILGTEDRPVEPHSHSSAFDDLDLAIIEHLQVDARTSNRSIAGRLGVSEGTVRARIKRMEDDKVIRIQPICDTGAVGQVTSAYVGVNVSGGRIGEVADHLVGLDRVATVMRSLGDHDLWVVVTATSQGDLAELVLAIGDLPGVRRTETTQSCGVLKHSYAWARIV